jgi:hypothetical protein
MSRTFRRDKSREFGGTHKRDLRAEKKMKRIVKRKPKASVRNKQREA